MITSYSTEGSWLTFNSYTLFHTVKCSAGPKIKGVFPITYVCTKYLIFLAHTCAFIMCVFTVRSMQKLSILFSLKMVQN